VLPCGGLIRLSEGVDQTGIEEIQQAQHFITGSRRGLAGCRKIEVPRGFFFLLLIVDDVDGFDFRCFGDCCF
jgi:hypothetical protein